VAWKWNAAVDGEDEYYRTTPLSPTAAVHGGDDASYAYAINPETGATLWTYKLEEGMRWQKAPRQFAGRGLPTGPMAGKERVVLVTPGYHMACSTRRPASRTPPFGTNGVVDLMDGLGFPLVPLAVDDNGALVISDGTRRARRSRAKMGSGDEDGRGRYGWNRSCYGQIAASCPRSSSAT
jgi:quinoprotein glucose dehydrogenase